MNLSFFFNSLLDTRNVQLAPDCSIGVASVHIKVDICEDDSKSICVSWGYQVRIYKYSFKSNSNLY